MDSPNPFDSLGLRCVEKVCNEVEHFLAHLHYSDEVGDNDEDEDIWRTQNTLNNGGLSKKHCLDQTFAMVATKLYGFLIKNVLYV